MNTLEITIKPLSGFGTPLKGDTIFGHLCWQVEYDPSLFGAPLNDLLADYAEQPFLVVSSAYPKVQYEGKTCYAVNRPNMPLHMLFADSETADRKDLKKRRWMLLGQGEGIASFRAATYLDTAGLLKAIGGDHEVSPMLLKEFMQPRNTINRQTGTTGSAPFAPFAVEQSVYLPGVELAVFVVTDAAITAEMLKEAFGRVGDTGFGKDASVGLGRFAVAAVAELDLASLGSANPNACYALAPCVPHKGSFVNSFFTPFTRFGRHGDRLAKSGNPFKNPVVMADDGAVFTPFNSEQMFTQPYFGSAVMNVSKAQPAAVVQGYAPIIPVRLGD
ncbi:MAG TPA: hypothetical protein VLH56_02860 [Dissulfurispiraceae bacterium]|nr:hypothetical protein [Dissulfurispiraceae bacterium]